MPHRNPRRLASDEVRSWERRAVERGVTTVHRPGDFQQLAALGLRTGRSADSSDGEVLGQEARSYRLKSFTQIARTSRY